MSITSKEIREVGFEHSLRGYDIEQVDVFLERMADGVDELTQELEALRAQLMAEPAPEPVAEPAPEPAPVAEAPDVDAAELEEANARAKEAETALAGAVRDLRAAELDANDLKDQLAALQKELDEKKERDSIISEAFIAAQRSAENLKEEARAEGERIYRESEAKARQLIREALVKKQQVFTEIDTLEASCAKFRKDYQKMLEHFTAEAESEFSDLRPPVIPDSIVNELMPKAPELADAAESAQDGKADAPSKPGIPADRIPTFEAEVLQADAAEGAKADGNAYADDEVEIEEV